MQHLEAHPVPVPHLPGSARFRTIDRGLLRGRGQNPRHRHQLPQGPHSARVLPIGMANDQHIHLCRALSAQERNHHRPTSVECRSQFWPGVIDQNVMLSLHHRRRPRTRIQKSEPEPARFRPDRRRPQQRQAQRHTEPASGQATRSQQHRDARQGKTQAP